MLPLLAAAIVLVACSKEEDTRPSVSFETAIPTTVDGASVLSITVKDYTGSDPVTIPVTFSGTAEKDVDYAVSAEAFVYGGTSPVTTIKVTPVEYGTGKTVSAALDIPGGFTIGKYTTSTFTLSDKVGYCSFVSKSAILTSSASIPVGIYDNNGSSFILQNGDEIAVSVNTDKSTAEEGVHFKFSDKSAAIISPSKNQGSVEIEFLKLEEGKDKIVLTLQPTSKYSIGNYQETTIDILGSYWDMLDGKWTMNEILTDQKFYEEMWSDMCTGYEFIPTYNSEDNFIINIAEGKFTPSFKSDFKNYFLGEANIVKGEEVTYHSGLDLSTVTVQSFIVDNVNRYFSGSDFSEDKEGYVGARIIDGPTSGTKLLELHIFDHTSKSFMPELLDFEMYSENKPVAIGGSHMAIIATFKKAE